MKKLFFLLLLCGIVLAGCSNQSPEQKLEEKREKSGYNKCMKNVEKSKIERKQCIDSKLQLSGYSDGIDCIQESQNGICKSIERYNAEVNASNNCLKEIKTYSPTECTSLLYE